MGGVFPLPLPHWNLYPTVVLTLTPSSSQVPSSRPEPTSTTLEGGGGGLRRQSKVLPPLVAADAKVFPARVRTVSSSADLLFC